MKAMLILQILIKVDKLLQKEVSYIFLSSENESIYFLYSAQHHFLMSISLIKEK